MEPLVDLLPRDLLLSNELAAQKKKEREFRIYAKLEPIVRIIAIGLITLLAFTYASLGYTQFAGKTILLYSIGVFLIHGGLTWLILYRFLNKYPSVYDVVSIMDYIFMTIGVYFTGGETSFLFFIYITRIADQIAANDKKRVLYFSILAPLCYFCMLLYISVIDGREISYRIEVIKMVSLFACSAYLMVVGRSVAQIRSRMTSFLRAAREAYRLLEEKRLELEKLNDQKNEFLGVAAHDLRNPLNAIQGFVSLLLHDIQNKNIDFDEAQEELNSILKLTSRMSKLVTDFLDIAAIESGKVHLNFEKCSINAVFDECEKFNIRAAAQKNIKLTIERSIGAPEVFVDKYHIMNVMENILSNAIKYTFPNGEVKIYCEITDSELITHIKDTGQGLSQDDLQHIFISFKKLSSRPTAGESSTGLGLAIVKKIIELHNGRVWVESVKGRGSTFSFSLPVSKMELEDSSHAG